MVEEREKFPILPIITGFFVAVLVLTPSAASKFINIGGLNINGSTIFFPISYLFNDILTEVYGYEKSRRIIWVGFASQIFAAAMYTIIQHLPPATFWHNQEAFDTILGQAPRIVLGSLTAYFVGEFINSFTLSRLKFLLSGRPGFFMAARFVASTFLGEFFDSALFLGIGFYGIIPTADLIHTVVTIWLLKSLYEVVSLPISLPLTKWIKRREGVDKIDRPNETNYSPFKL
jgi:queuosine precursor transporter